MTHALRSFNLRILMVMKETKVAILVLCSTVNHLYHMKSAQEIVHSYLEGIRVSAHFLTSNFCCSGMTVSHVGSYSLTLQIHLLTSHDY